MLLLGLFLLVILLGFIFWVAISHIIDKIIDQDKDLEELRMLVYQLKEEKETNGQK